MHGPDDAELETLLEGSSLDTPGARRLRQRTSVTQAGVVQRLRKLAPHIGAVPEPPDVGSTASQAPVASPDADGAGDGQSGSAVPGAAAVVIRAAEQSDLEGLHRVDRLVFGRLAYPFFALRQLLDLHARHCLVADDGSRLIGYCLGAVSGRPRVGWLLGLAVLPDARDAGHGRDLVHETVRRMAAEGVGEVRLAVDPENSGAIHLYETLGFRISGFRPDYFGPEGDRLIMTVDCGRLVPPSQRTPHRTGRRAQRNRVRRQNLETPRDPAEPPAPVLQPGPFAPPGSADPGPGLQPDEPPDTPGRTGRPPGPDAAQLPVNGLCDG